MAGDRPADVLDATMHCLPRYGVRRTLAAAIGLQSPGRPDLLRRASDTVLDGLGLGRRT